MIEYVEPIATVVVALIGSWATVKVAFKRASTQQHAEIYKTEIEDRSELKSYLMKELEDCRAACLRCRTDHDAAVMRSNIQQKEIDGLNKKVLSLEGELRGIKRAGG